MMNATNVQFEGPDDMVAAFATAREAAAWALQGFYDGTAHYILDQRKEPGCQTVWKQASPDYRTCHAEMVAEIERRVVAEALAAALAAGFGDEEKPRYTTRRLRLETDRAFERGRQQAFDEMLTAAHDGIPPVFTVGEQVEKHTGDYTAGGEVRAVFAMKNGAIRFVVEHQAEGGGSFCHIYSEKNLRKVNASATEHMTRPSRQAAEQLCAVEADAQKTNAEAEQIIDRHGAEPQEGISSSRPAPRTVAAKNLASGEEEGR